MTREEAVTVLKVLMENPLFSEVHKVAFNIAIHDIKQRHDWDINNLILINKENYEPQSFKWCTDCKEYDQEKHCCHRFSKVIRGAVAELRKEPTLDKIRAEIIQSIQNGTLKIESGNEELFRIIDKYKVESEG